MPIKFEMLFLLLSTLCFYKRVTAVDMTVVAVFEDDYPLPREVVNKMFERFARKEFPDITFHYHSIILEDEETEASMLEIGPASVSDPSLVCEKIVSPGPSFLIDTTRRPRATGSRASTLVKTVARRMAVPTVSTTYAKGSTLMEWDDLSEQEREYLVQIPPPGFIITQVVRDIAEHLKMTTTGVLFDKSIEMDQKYSTLLQNIATRASILTVEADRQKIQEQALKMKTSDTAYYFVIGSTNTINYALEVAENNNMTGREYAWFLVSLDPTEPGCNCKNFSALWMSPTAKVNMRRNADTLMREFEFPSEAEVAFYYDLVLMTVKAVRQEIIDGNWPSKWEPQSCSVPDSEERKTIKLLTALKQTNYTGMFGDFRFRPDGNHYQEIEMLMQKLTFNQNEARETKTIGSWIYNQPKGYLVFGEGGDLSDFKAYTVYQVTTIEIPPFVIKTQDENGKTVFTGYCVELLNAIKEILKFDYNIFETQDKVFGRMDDNGEWNGMMRDLVDKKAEIALGPISVMAERETVVDFTVPYYDLVGISILMRKPSVPSSLFKFLTVLETNVWACILAAYFVTSFLMFLFDRLSPYSYFNNREKFKDDDDDEKRDFSLKESLWFCMTSLTPQGGGEAPRNLSGRLVAATWWLFGFIIIASYTANLAAFLTVSRLDSPIESLDDLAKQYKIKYAPQESSSAATYFQRMAYIEEKFYEIWKNMSLDDTLNETERAKLAVWDYPVSDKYTKIWWTMQETGLPRTFEEGIEKVLNSKAQEGFAFIADSTQVKYAVMTNCELISVGNEFSRKPLALAVQQGSPLKDQISSAILKLLNMRKLESLKERWWNKNPARVECDDSEQQSDGISIANIGGVFIVIFIGVVLACITLAIEYWFYRKRKQRNTKVEKYPDQKHERH